MKKIFAVALIAAASSAAFAQTSKFEGLSGTAALGYQSVNPKFENAYDATGAALGEIGTSSSTGVVGNFGLDYTQRLSDNNVLIYGVDYAFGTGSKKDVTVGGRATTMTASYTQKYRFSIAPGFLISNDTLGYFKLGMGTATQKITDNTTEDFNAKFYSYGGGFRTMQADGMFYFGEINFISGTKKSNTANDGTTLDTKPSGYNIMFGIGKRF